ncbi:nucleotidyltransferase [Desulfobacter hydrogenophilus]|uniref:Nucleotidyltransferase n=1 Tax=Desulfobacter hydrogenophilus TaxID=2291 RepID=A0A328FDI8_9BACT|nr:nucleotidyltransferase [Desulfobacter hydrogenophilus]NDY73111.1 nucleotidyltransferase [Desulfobacter hydrogenophilus]QBH13543.1 nucleotidyltransferase [Desulfobacter hydrogenophilus]RAM01115.1 nucleotidyltransferase [Desulfobacter hydrogenophilus]
MTVNSYLISLASGLVLSSDEKASITKSISTLKIRLEAYFGGGITNHFQFGSNNRGTILPRKADSKSDIDYMIIFNTSDGKKTPQTYLNRLKRFAKNKYSTSEISQSSPTIVLSLNHINFELVPAVSDWVYQIQIPSPASDWSNWMSTDPNGTNQALMDKNISENYKIKPLVRLIKYWNATHGHPYNSFSLERYIVNQFFGSCTTQKDYFYFFWSGFEYTYETAQYIKDKVDRAKRYAKQAKEYEYYGMSIAAETEIKKILPEL